MELLKIPEVPWQLQKVTCEQALVSEAFPDLENILKPWIWGIPAGLGLSGERKSRSSFQGSCSPLPGRAVRAALACLACHTEAVGCPGGDPGAMGPFLRPAGCGDGSSWHRGGTVRVSPSCRAALCCP